tara:strand:+ start:273 stop:590 length:318 start_codon:yes stop_codon:yes gene_type:complete
MLNNQITLLIGVLLVLGAVVIYLVLKQSDKYSVEHRDNVENMNNDALKAKIREIAREYELLQEENIKLNDKIAAIHLAQGIHHEHTKYLNANLNAHTSMGTPIHG